MRWSTLPLALVVGCTPPAPAASAPERASTSSPSASSTASSSSTASPATTDDSAADAIPGSAPDAGSVADAKPANPCPESFDFAAYSSPPASCRATSSGHCTYPEGTCDCRKARQCGGAQNPPDVGEWSCTPFTPFAPTALRLDGCPFGQPKQNAACKTIGKVCAYGYCGSIQATCKGTWSLKSIDVARP